MFMAEMATRALLTQVGELLEPPRHPLNTPPFGSAAYRLLFAMGLRDAPPPPLQFLLSWGGLITAASASLLPPTPYLRANCGTFPQRGPPDHQARHLGGPFTPRT